MSVFFDSNIALYLLSIDERKARIAEDLLEKGGSVSVQVLNEFVSVARRKHRLDWTTIGETLDVIKSLCAVQALTRATHDRAFEISRRLGFHIYDSTIIASALDAGVRTLYSEDLQHGQRVDGVRVVNPFRVS